MIRIEPRLLVTLSALLLTACDGGPSAVPARNHAEAPAAAESPKADPRDAPVPLVDGKPMWSANKRFTAEENAARAFERNGADFGATTVEAFVKKAHAFVSDPPRGALTRTRANGDTLIYDPKANVFAVRTKDGAPRTMFKPKNGVAYWEEQQVREAKRSDEKG